MGPETGYHSDPVYDHNDSVAYNNYDSTRKVPSLVHSHEHTTKKTQQHLFWLNIAASSLISKIDLIKNHTAYCAKCKGKKSEDSTCEFLEDNGVSATFTNTLSNFFEYQEIDNGPSVTTATKSTPLTIKGQGTVFITHEDEEGSGTFITTHLDPVFYIPGLSQQLLSLGDLLQSSYRLHGNNVVLVFYRTKSVNPTVSLYPYQPGKTLYWLNTQITHAASLSAKSTIFIVDYDFMHHHFGHPSKDVLRQASGKTKNFPKGIIYPKENPVCRGCMEEKMLLQSFPLMTS